MTPAALHIPVLETERLRLRPPAMDDWPAFDAFFRAPRSHFNGGPVEDARQRFRVFSGVAGQWLLRGYGSFVVADRESGAAIGLVGLWHPVHWPEPEIGWSLWDAEREGRGLAREAAEAAIADAYGRVGVETCVSYIAPDNARSIALAERLGAVRDDAAGRPAPDDLVYRHPRREAA